VVTFALPDVVTNADTIVIIIVLQSVQIRVNPHVVVAVMEDVILIAEQLAKKIVQHHVLKQR